MEDSGLPPSAELIELHRRLIEGELPVDARSRAQGGVSFPPMLSLESGDEAFVGREDVSRRLRERYARAREGTRQFVVLCGEPGIGKTRLASEFAREAHAGGAIVLYGRSDPETLVPYQPFVTAIGHYVAECGDVTLARELGPELSELSRLIPGLARRMPELREPLAVEPEMRRYRLFNAVSSVLAFVARERPAVLILDDLQWADPSTALLLRHTIQGIHDVKLLVLGTLRDVEECGSDELAELLARPRAGYERIGLAGLDADEVARLVFARQRRGATADAVGVLLEATAGNPLFLEETLRSIAESAPDDERVSEQAVRRIGLPEGAKHVIGRRLERLDATAQRALADRVGDRRRVRRPRARGGQRGRRGAGDRGARGRRGRRARARGPRRRRPLFVLARARARGAARAPEQRRAASACTTGSARRSRRSAVRRHSTRRSSRTTSPRATTRATRTRRSGTRSRPVTGRRSRSRTRTRPATSAARCACSRPPTTAAAARCCSSSAASSCGRAARRRAGRSGTRSRWPSGT